MISISNFLELRQKKLLIKGPKCCSEVSSIVKNMQMSWKCIKASLNGTINNSGQSQKDN